MAILCKEETLFSMVDFSLFSLAMCLNINALWAAASLSDKNLRMILWGKIAMKKNNFFPLLWRLKTSCLIILNLMVINLFISCSEMPAKYLALVRSALLNKREKNPSY